MSQEQQSIAHYRITSKLGEGGMGAVYRATDTKLNREVAVKVLPDSFAADPDRLARFAREAQVLASLNHPHIAAIYGLEEKALVMELVEGETLGAPVSVDTALVYARQMVDALEYAHEKGIIHRDLKPANVRITPEGQLKLLDFGLAKIAEQGAPPPDAAVSPTLTMRATQLGMIVGTAAYMAPEQARAAVVDRRADIFSFGAVLYEMLTGRQAFPGESVTDVLAAVVKSEPGWSALPAETPAAIRQLLRLCLAKDRKQRLQAIGDARIFLDAKPETAPAAPVKHAWLPWTVTAAAVLAAAALAFVHFRESASEVPRTAFLVPPPNKMAFQGNLAVSPDGRRVAFIAIDATGSTQLWVRDFASLESRLVPGTEGARGVFWQPEGRWIGYLTTTLLKKIDASGGTSLTLAPLAGPPRGAAWSRNGVILYGAQGGPISSVSAAGGDAAPLTTLDASRREMEHNFPWLLPDEEHFLLLIHSSLPENQGIFVASIRNPSVRSRLLPDNSRPIFDSGRLLFVRGGALMAQPFDPDRLELHGEAVPITAKIGFTAYAGIVSFGASGNGVLAWSPRFAVNSSARLAWFDRSGKELATVGPVENYVNVAIAPSGKWIAAGELSERARTLIIDPLRGTASPLAADSVAAVWSPDGSQVAYGSIGKQALFLQDPHGARPETPLVETQWRKSALDWSGDGRTILYMEVGEGGKGVLWTVPALGDGKPTRLPLQVESSAPTAKFSPDKRWIAYTNADTGVPQVYVQSFPLGSGKWQISTDGGEEPHWRRDGRELFYIDPRGRMMSVEIKPGASFDPGPPKPLFTFRRMNNAYSTFRYDVSGDGQKFLILTPVEMSASDPLSVVMNWTKGIKP